VNARPARARQARQARQARRDDVTARIVRLGRAHLAEHGAAALSLRAVTRDLGLVSSAVYRYVANRDELLTLLLVDAYTELADAVDTTVSAASGQPWAARILRAAHAVREWALREPARYALLYGSPVPGYSAPAEQTTGPGTRVVRALLALVAEGVTAGDIGTGSGTGPAPLPASLRPGLAAVATGLGLALPPDVLARATMLWSVLIGAVSLEVFGQYGADTLAEPGLLLEYQVRCALTALTTASSPAGAGPQRHES
jgi:AcrR family transcriptional regulator